MTVLVIEDDRSQSHLMKIVLEGEGIDVRVVDHDFKRLMNPQSSLYEGIDIVCTDLDLGPTGPNGKEILTLVKEHFPNMRRVIITGWEEPLDEYADIVLYKVVSIDDVVEALT